MKLDRDTMKALDRWIRPLVTRVANTVARGVVKFASDGSKLQTLQVGALAGEVIDGAEHFQQYGFSSIPLDGAECVLVFPNADRSHPLVIATGDRSSRPTGGKPGEVTVYSHTGAKVTLLEGGNVEIQPGPSGQVLIRQPGGTTDRLVTKSEHDGHTHPAGTLAAPSGGGPVTGVTGGAPAVAGTQTLQAE